MMLTKPYPTDLSLQTRWKMAIGFSLFVFIFLLIFQPFGLASYPRNLVAVTFGYGIVCFTIMLVTNILIPKTFPTYFIEENWTTGKELAFTAFNICSIGIANGIFSAFIGIGFLNLQTLAIYLLYTLAVGVFPVSIFIMAKQSFLRNRFEKNSERFNQLLKEEKLPEHPPIDTQAPAEIITIFSENQKDELKLQLSNLLFIQAADNYIEVHYLEQQKLKKVLIRNSLKQIEQDLIQHPVLFRCHKSFLVNIKKISSFSGNAQGYRLHFKETVFKVPVSRKLNEKVQGLFAFRP
jgi:hypothetical protein